MVKKEKSVKKNENVAEYMQNTNRPYSVNDIVLNLHSVVSRTEVVKALTKLESDGIVVSKTFGRAVIYFTKQAPISEKGTVEHQIEEIADLKEQLDAGKKKAIQLKSELSAIQGTKTTEQLEAYNKQITEEIEELEKKLASIGTGKEEKVSEIEVEKLLCDIENLNKEKIKRKKMAIEENCPNSNEIKESIGIEDENENGDENNK